MDFVLKRLCSREKIVLNVEGKSYTCGRGRENEIICLSLLVSRKHCLFFHDTNKLYVTDLNSSNGIFINGIVQKPYKMVMLVENDVVGIGSYESQSSNESYVYKVCIRKSSCPTEAVDTSILSKTVLNCDAPSKQQNSPKRCILEEECGSNLTSEMTVPNKIRKCTNGADSPGKNPNISHDHGSSSNGNSANNLEMAFNSVTVKTENDIEIIQTSPSTSITTKISNNEANSMLHFTHASDQVVKLEDELQITDDDDANLTDTSSKTTSMNSKSAKSRRSKKISQTQFSEIDVVELSDDENGVFPPSQLFDITFANQEIKTEIKQECINNNSEKVDLLEIDDEVIILTDSEDEDEDEENPWLHRLSRSQLISQDKESDANMIVKEEVDFGIWDNDDISCIIKSEVLPVTKDYDEINDVKPMADVPALDASKIPISEKKSVEQETSSASDKIDREDSNTELLTKRTTETDDGTSSLMKVDDPFKESISENVKHTNREGTDVNRDKKSNEQKEMSDNLLSHSAKSRSDITKSTTTFKRVIQVIEAPHLPTKKGRSGKAIKLSEEQSSSKSTAKETKIQKLNEKVNNNFYNKEQKDKKETSKKTTIDCSQSSKVIKTSISKEKKKIIAEERKAKLKRIAEEEKKLCTDQVVKRGTAKPRAKISLKNRGDFLINGQESLTNTSAKHIKPSSDQFQKQSINNADMSKDSAISDSETKLQQKEDLSKNALNDVESLEQSLCLTKTPSIKIPKSDKSVKSSEATNVVRKHSKRKKINNEANAKIPELKKESNEFASIAEKNRDFSNKKLKSESVVKKEKKRVSFSEKTQIIEYEIDIKNSLKKLEGKKDAPMPDNKMVKAAWNGGAEWRPKLEEFLLHIFMWNPVWLEEQRYLKTEPPIVPESELQPMRMRYDSFQQYYKVVLPLLLQETWHTMTKDFEMVGKNMQRATVVCSIVANSITRTPIPSTNLFLTTLMLEILVSKEDLNNRTHPRYGDLISFEYVKNANGRPISHKVFAYITKMQPIVITDFTYYNKDLRNYVRNPFQVITYTVLTRPLENDIPVNRVQRIRTVTYLRANMRMVQALQYLPQSPLLNLILNPKIDNYQLPSINSSHTCCSLVTKDKLNPKQKEAVLKVAATVLNEQSKLCFIQGPPGTGKSRVIVNLVTQILYSENENKNAKKPLSILICAPSNAAIDEIVMRLLTVRSTLERRFNMVRIGRPETMHPQAKNISVTELAKRYLKKIAEKGVSWSLVNDGLARLKEEKTMLQGRIDWIQNELKDSTNMLDERRRELKRQFNDATIKLQILTYGKPIDDFSPKDRERYQRTAEDTILAGADIIACTLSSCYTNQMESIFGVSKKRLSVCIVDEATQSCEAETLIPLMLGVNTLALVGDPNQLPATILSQRAKKLGLDQSLFSRVQGVFASQTNNPIVMLDTQYRMEYDISYWPNRFFYNAKLKNAVETKLTFPFHAYRVLNHTFSQNNDKFSNTTEAEFVANMIYAMLIFAKWENTNNCISIGILTPYNNQRTIVVNKINETISSVPENLKKKINIEVNTVDSFQGQERDIIIMSCVRSEGIGFLSDRQRLCVALTRAKHSLILCGNFNTFMKDLMWKALLSDARSRGIFYNIEANATPAIIKPFVVK